jgi:hypothetical protein
MGADPEDAQEVFGIAPLVVAAVPLAGKVFEGATGGTVGDFFSKLGRRIGETIGTRKAVKPPRKAAVEADAATLPPVYVADTGGFQEDLATTREATGAEVEPVGNFTIEDRFGETARVGLIDRQGRAGARQAANAALARGQDLLASAPASDTAAFVEDGAAEPILYGDGTLWEPVYGAMSAVPCPSCAAVHYGAAQAGSGHDCAVCDGYGAILVPTADAPAWNGVRYGILLPLIAGAIWATQTEEGKEALGEAGVWLREKTKGLKKKKKGKKGKKGKKAAAVAAPAKGIPSGEAAVAAAGSPEDALDLELAGLDTEEEEILSGSPPVDDDEEGYGVARAIAPRDWFTR